MTKQQSGAYQDLFVANMMENREGYFVDIGSAHAINSNNTIYLEKNLKWSGLCIEIDSRFNSSYSQRNCHYINDNALTIDYSSIFDSLNVVKHFDYLSLDIDELSINVLLLFPFDLFKPKIITVEHDAYLHGDKYRRRQRELLISQGYHLICKDVLVEQSHDFAPKTTIEPFEDWWILPEFFDDNLIVSAQSDREYGSDIVNKLYTYHNQNK